MKNNAASNLAPCALPAARQSAQPEARLNAQRSSAVSQRTEPKLTGEARSKRTRPTSEARVSGQIAIIRRFSPVWKFRIAARKANNATTRKARANVATVRKLKDKKKRLAIAAPVRAIQPR